VVFVGVDLLIDGGAFLKHFGQSWNSHFGAAKSYEYGSTAEHPYDWSVLVKNWDATVLAVVGVFFVLNKVWGKERSHPGPLPKERESQKVRLLTDVKARGTWQAWQRSSPTGLLIVPVLWVVWTVVVFSIHRPWWSYYYVHNAIPLALCAGMGAAFLMQSLCRRPQEFRLQNVRKREVRLVISSPTMKLALLAVFGLCAAGWMGGRVYLQVSDIRRAPKVSSTLSIAEMRRYKAHAKFLYADEPIFSFYAGIPMPPQLAVLPLKRLWAGDMTNARIAEELYRVQPELMLLKNDTQERPFSELLNREYQLVYEDKDRRLFARKSIARLRED
jgi:hypothetical protein